MNTKTLAALGAVLALAAVYAQADHFGTAFTYQGQLVSGGQAANGLYDLQFKLYDSLAGGTGQVGGTLTSNAVPVANGLFTVALDFGDGIFTGPPRWLEIAVRTNSAVTFVTLSPRQQLNPSPYALFTPNADVAVMATTANSVANNAVTAPGIAAGNVVKSVNALKDDVVLAPGANLSLTPSGQTITLSSPTDWHIGGNASTTPGVNFLGTTDNQALELHINGTRALRLEPNTYAENNTIGGAWVNTVGNGVVGATIGGGGSANRGGNNISTDFGTIGGGFGNSIATNAVNSTIGGGSANLILSNAFQSTIAGGFFQHIREDAYDSTIGGGWQNEIQQKATGATIAGGYLSTIQPNAGASTIGGGANNQIQTNASNSTIAGGVANGIQHDSFSSVIGGGQNNAILPYVGGGVIGGGSANTNGASYATVPGGQNNLAGGAYSFAAGQRAKALNQGAFVWADSQAADFSSTAKDQFLIRAAGNVGINKNNPATALDVNGTVTATSFSGPGAGLTGLPAGQLTGTVPSGLLAGTYGNALTLNNPANSFGGDGSGLTGLNASQLTSGTVPDARLSANVALLNRDQTFTGTNRFGNGSGVGRLIVNTSGTGSVNTNRFTGVSLQYDSWYGEGALMSSYDNGQAYLSFYTKPSYTNPVTKQVIIERWGGLAIDQGDQNDGGFDHTSFAGVGLSFGVGSGEGIASKRTTGANQYGLDFYTGYNRQLSIGQSGAIAVFENTIFLRPLGDANHGLGYYGASKPFAGTAPDGPVLFGYTGGALGTEQWGTEKIALTWNGSGYVGVGSTNPPVVPLDVRGNNYISATTDGILNIGPASGYHLTLDADDLQAKYAGGTSTLYLNYYGGNVNLCAGQLYAVYGSGVGIGTSSIGSYKFYVNGTAYSTGGWSGSDARWKKNVQPVTGALDKITQLQGVTYDWRRDEFPEKNFEDGSQLGFLAQDVEKIVPEAVRTDASGYKAIAYEKLTAVLTEGVKEQQAEIGALKARNATLEKDVAELKALVEQLLHK